MQINKDNQLDSIYAVVGARILTQNESREILHDHAIVIADTLIQDIMPVSHLEESYGKIPIVGGLNKVIIPGLINTHMHSNLVRGFGDDLSLYDWHESIAEAVSRVTTADDAYLGAKNSYCECIKTGTTTILGLEKHADRCYEAAIQSGIRAVIVPYILDFPDCVDTIKKNIELVEQTSDPDARVRFWFGFDSFREASEVMIKEIVELANIHNSGIHTHSNESIDDVRTCVEMYGVEPIEHLSSLGVLGSRTVLAHAVHLSEREVDLVAETKTKVSHCITSNLKLNDGISPVTNFLTRGIGVGLGTDGANTSNSYDLFEEIKLSVLMQRHIANRADVMVASEALDLATISGAKVLGLEEKIGSIEVGKKADICLIDPAKLHFLPYDSEFDSLLLSHLTYATTGADIETVIIDGRIVMKDRIILTLDESNVIENSNKAGQDLLRRLTDSRILH